jgi:hypothetical protein
MLKNIPSIPKFLQCFYHERLLDFAKGFFFAYGEDHMVCVLASVYMLYYIYGFMYVELSLHP